MTRQLTVDDEFDVDTVSLEPAGDDGPNGGTVSQQCDPEPEWLSTGSHISNLTLIDAWEQRYRLWGDDESEEPGIAVQNTVTVDKAPERVDGSLLYGVRLYSLCHIENGHLSRHRLERMENEVTIDPDVEVRSILPSSPIRADDGRCTLTLLTELPSGWNAGYEQYWTVNDGTMRIDHVDDTVSLSLDGDVSSGTAMKGLLELRSDRPLTEFDEVFTWTVRGEATRKGL